MTCSYKFNRQCYTSMSFHNVVGTGSDTTSTTNMYHKDFTHHLLNGVVQVVPGVPRFRRSQTRVPSARDPVQL